MILDRTLLIETRIIVHGTDDDADQHCQWVISPPRYTANLLCRTE